ncbi:hypothetical protein [Mycobacterium sp. SMC-4]|uniref:hypothetical protein n=1 Tax=Mycobacterium sp. SMC-4 TaxID=2857059 RepID=UPI003D0830A6
MKKVTLSGLVATGTIAGVLGFASPAYADDGGLDYTFGGTGNSWAYNNGYGLDDRNNPWLDKLYPNVKVPTVDTSVRN